MDITNKTILVLGGWGLVGAAVCRRLLKEHPARIIVTSLGMEEAEEGAAAIRSAVEPGEDVEIIPWGGNVFGRYDERFRSRDEILATSEGRRRLFDDVIDDLSSENLHASALYRLLEEFRPDAVVDCINTATAIAYQDVYTSARGVMKSLDSGEGLNEEVERLLATLYTPQLIRHIQILYRGLVDCGAAMYIKIGTAGAGGMGLNIPYTHSEERPSRVLLSKSSVAGAHTLLLFMMGRTPDGPVIKEIKPTATIAWKRIEHGEVLRRGRPIPLVDCPPEQGVRLSDRLTLRHDGLAVSLGETLKAPFIDTGENGIFSRGEFEAISSLQQMEMITPEEIAEAVALEMRGGNSGHDVVAALDGSVYGPTYRGGYLRGRALERLESLENSSGVPSVAFEMLGPPRLSKLLYEAHIIGLVCGSIDGVIAADPVDIVQAAEAIIRTNRELRSRVISIGIPILLSDGVTLLRGDSMKIPPWRGESEIDITPASLEGWADAGWVDLRADNIRRWQGRFERIKRETLAEPEEDSSSRINYSRAHWEHFRTMPAGKVVAWIFTVEDEGARMKA
jgi:NAD(P)-dependent dehydrogenase (short-subunit alcohol dehydrogenase family)